jgi:hypothetical protein
MKISRILCTNLFIVIYLFVAHSFTLAQNCDASTLDDFYDCYGGQSAFSEHSIRAVTTFIQAEDAIHQGNYAQAKNLIELLFDTYPKGSNVWWNVWGGVNGSNVGSPHGYYGLRMMEDIVDHHLNTNTANIEVRKVNMTAVLVGCSEGIQPTNLTELQNGTGPFITNNLDPSLQTDDYRIVRQSFDLFTRYIRAITKGQLEVEVEIIELPQLCLDVSVSSTKPYFATGPISPVWNAISDETKDATDFWLITYPSHVPEGPEFDNESFITGGMGQDSKGGPVFIADDKWIVRKPAHLGSGSYSDIERRIYLPQWYQHEFFHHLFNIYPEYELEVNGHDWFDLNFWPDDFEGQFETDFYTEALHKRLQTDCVPLASKLITRVDNLNAEQFSKLSIDELIGDYSLDNIQNNWHEGEILKQGNQYFWRNKANVQWEIFPNLATGRLETGVDCPYPDQDFFLELYRTIDGKHLPGVVALKFLGEQYRKRFNLLRESVPFEISLGEYTRVPYESTFHMGKITKEAGIFYWQDEGGNKWLLGLNGNDESFTLGDDSPSPDDTFQLILSEGECELTVLGFKYLGYYYWREKSNSNNGSPILVNPLEDLQLDENFNPYSIDLTNVFSDPEDDIILYFATSSSSDLVEASIENKQLILTGGQPTTVTIYLTAIDSYGGLVTDEFTLQVGNLLSTQEEGFGKTISIFPNPAHNIFTVAGILSQTNIAIYSARGNLVKEVKTSNHETTVNLRGYDAGVYFIGITNQNSGKTTFKKLVKFP